VALEELYLAHNGFDSLAHLPPSLQRLRVLDLGGNKIAQVPPALGTWPELEDLWMNDNAVASAADACGVSSASALKTLYLEGNPFARADDYHERILSVAPATLRQLDALQLNANWPDLVARAPSAPVGAPS